MKRPAPLSPDFVELSFHPIRPSTVSSTLVFWSYSIQPKLQRLRRKKDWTGHSTLHKRSSRYLSQSTWRSSNLIILINTVKFFFNIFPIYFFNLEISAIICFYTPRIFMVRIPRESGSIQTSLNGFHNLKLSSIYWDHFNYSAAEFLCSYKT